MTERNKKVDIAAVSLDTAKMFFRHFALCIFLMSVFGGISFYATKMSYVPLYQSSATFMVRPSVSAMGNDPAAGYAALSQIAKAFPYIIMNDGMKQIIGDETGSDPAESVVHVESLADTNSFSVSVINRDADMAAKVLQMIISNYSVIGEKVIGDTYVSLISGIDTPNEPVNAQNAKRNSLIAMAAVLGVLACVFGVYACSKKCVKTRRDLVSNINTACLCAMPRIKVGRKGRILATDVEIPYVFSEQVKKLKIRVKGVCRELDAKSVLVTSSIADEGKSTVAANLAASLAQNGSSVLLADFDFRNPSVLKMFGFGRDAAEFGIVDLYDHPETDISDIIVKDISTGVDILCSGSLKGRSIKSLLNTGVLVSVMDRIRDSYDFIVIDTPPSSILSDSADIAHLADCCIYVVRSDYAPLSVIMDGLDMLGDTGLKIAGCVLNYAPKSRRGKYGYYYRKGN